ncbi:unnamed protein product [Pedinophyceae sp. YPF-701]|nr:unnamed protein product [Pedinophyceae sp. YPF-701]
MIADTVAAEALQVVQPFVSMMASLVLLPAIVQPPFAQHVPALSAILARTLRTTESYDVAEQLLAIALRALEPAPLLLAAAIIPAAIAALTSCSEARDAAAVEATASRVVRDAARPCARLLANLGAGEADGTQQPEAVGGAVHAQDATRLAFDHCIAPLAGAARLADRDARTFFWDTLWQQCIGMVLARTPEATTRLADARSLASGLGFLVRFAEDTLPSPETDADVLAARTRPELWEALRMGLHHDADVVRKRSAYLLSAALPSPHPPRWRCFLRLYSVLDEFGTHLVEQAWDDVTRLVPDANAAPATSPAVVSDPAAYDAMLGFDWTMVVWQKALRHSNPNVQRRALTSLIELHGGATLRGAIPCEFVAGAVLPALLSVHHYAPASGAPSDRNWSEAPWTTGTGPAADAFLREWAADCGAPRAGRAAVAWLASGTVMGSCGGGISRTGLSAACGALAALASAGPWQLQPEDARDVLGALTRLALGAASHWDSEFRKAVFCDIAAAACAVAPDDVEAVLLLLDAFPSVARCPTRVLGRSAYPVLQAWLAPPRDSPEAPHRCWRMIDDFVAGPGPSPDTAAPALDLASLDAWERRARQLARLAVVADLAGACETGAMGLATRLSQVYRATYAPVGSAERAMLVLAALLCELEAWLAGRAGADGVASPFAADGAQECDGVVDDLLASLTHLCVFLLEAASGEVTQLALAALQGGAGGDDGVALLRDDASAQAAAVAMQIPTGNAPEAGGDVLASVVSRLFRAAYGCCMSGGKRDASATAACLLSATLSAHTFEGHLDRLRALHAPDGPVPWLVTRLTDQASRSTRVARILAAHLGKAVLAVPSAGMRYLGALSTLAQLPASECPVNDQEREFTADLATQSGMRRDGAEHNVLLPGQTALSPAVEARLSATSVAARAAALCCLYELATSEDRDALSVARVLWCALLWDAVKGEVGSDTEYREGSAIHRVKIRLWHAIVVLSSALPDYSDTEGPFIDPDILAQLPADALPRGVNLQDALDLAADPSKAMAALHAVYSRSEHPTIRILAEVTGARVIWQAPRLYEDVVLTRLHDYTARHEGVGSYLVIAASLAMALQRRAAESGDEEAQRALADRVRRLTSIALPWATVCNHGKRALAEVLLHELLVRHFPACADGNPALEAYRKYCSESAEVRRFIRQIAPRLRTFDPGQPITPGELLGGSASVAGPWPPLPLRFEGAEPTFVDAIHAYLMDARQTLRTEVNAAARMRAAAENSLREAAASGAAPPAVDRQRGAIQRKIDVADARGAAGAFGPLDLSWLSDARSCAGGASLVASATWPFAPWSLFGEALAGGGVADAGVEGGGGVSRQGLVVVGTLVDKVPNLAGLARTCEVFRAERLVVSDKKVAKDHMFQSIASSAEHLTPLEEVHQEDLPGWLRAMRAAGYALYGLEQTDSSESLPEARFPDKSVLLLGAEGDGIPAPLLQLMDSCVEIPQLGLVRSLNVHVAGAITVYEYTRQRLTGGGRHLLAGSAVLT